MGQSGFDFRGVAVCGELEMLDKERGTSPRFPAVTRLLCCSGCPLEEKLR